jgi:pimeloyl-ACP methyl ester carboxylesterase
MVVAFASVGLVSLAGACSDDRTTTTTTTAETTTTTETAAVAAVPATGLVRVADGVLVEYRDWGGSGPTVVLLTGLGNTAAVFDDLAPRLVGSHRVIGFTRRGFAPSTVTDSGYDVATRAADDIAALEAFGIDRALLVGHSIAGDELTAIARQRPDLVAGLVYLDAALDRSDPQVADLANCYADVPSIDTVLDLSADVVEVDGEVALVDLATAARLQGVQLGGSLPLSEVRRQFAVTSGSAFAPIEPGPSIDALQAGSAAFTPDYSGISVPVTALYGDDTDPAVAFPLTALAPAEVRERLADCASAVAAAKKSAGADRVRAHVPDAVVEVVPGGPHYFFVQQPDLTARKILETSARVDW